jgi:hypothetical protein
MNTSIRNKELKVQTAVIKVRDKQPSKIPSVDCGLQEIPWAKLSRQSSHATRN